ncbi:NAD(+) diphosphatase [Sphingomonas gilva]|uniref:NAD(+) diphosphatase n=1 Tax=Sphingomonas gilva TaxID=2305907 RepID=UPI001FEA40A9|nr:NAD(+) diphosphatase [Sphingomonas gilva]
MRPGLTGSPLDRADKLRGDPEAFAALLGDVRARVLDLTSLDPVVTAEGMIGWKSLAEAHDQAELILLGLDGGVPHLVEWRMGQPDPIPRSPAVFRALATLSPDQAQIYASARSLLEYHRRHGFCANCGAVTRIFRAGWGRRCDACGTEHFPRVDPVVIMLAEHDDRVLIGRSAGYPPGRYSALAGFVEPAESIEEAVARELHEEAGIRVSDVRYVASQPWPFAHSLMMGCMAAAADDALTIDATELEDAIWVSRDAVRAAMAGDPDAPFLAPPPYAIAHTLFARWIDE